MLTNIQEDRVFNALADGTRRQIVRSLALRPLPVFQIAKEFKLTRPAISRHLRILKEASLVEVAKAGRQNLYYLKPSVLREVEDWLNGIWASRLAKLKILVEETPHD
jgi:DNA-binding transcriptional ArsR family regulator